MRNGCPGPGWKGVRALGAAVGTERRWDLEKRNDQDLLWGDNRRGRQGVQPG